MEQNNKSSGRTPKMLPTVHQDEEMYFIDLHLKEFRLHTTPWEPVPFDSDRGKELCDQLNILTCPACGLSVIVPGVSKRDDLRCSSCLQLLNGQEAN